MKKIAILAFMSLASMSFSWDWGISPKLGLDSFRNNVIKENISDNDESYTVKSKQDGGLTIGLDVTVFESRFADLGLGLEYVSGKFVKYNTTQTFTKVGDDSANPLTATTKTYTIPMYLLGHFNMLNNKEAKIYVLGRLGYAVSKSNELDAKAQNQTKANVLINQTAKDFSGLYYGLGLGTEIKNFVIEGLYDGIYHPKGNGVSKVYTNMFGVRIGYKLNDKTFSKNTNSDESTDTYVQDGYEVLKKVKRSPRPKPAPEPEPTPVPEPMPAPSPVPEVEPKKEAPKDNFMNSMCDEAAKICVIHGFKVDGGHPNAEEADRLRAIAESVNNFAKSGTIDVVGHTDSVGRDAYNMALSERRAKMVAKLLKEYGLKDSLKIRKVYGLGETDPVDTNKTKEGRYNNRRVEIRFIDLVK